MCFISRITLQKTIHPRCGYRPFPSPGRGTPIGFKFRIQGRQSHFVSDDWFKASPEEYGRAASTYFAYAGPFRVDEEKSIVTHIVLVSLFPNWIGQKQQRVARIEGDKLHLSTAAPIQAGGRSVNAYLQWRRLGSCRATV
jgi:hypothetical protein